MFVSPFVAAPAEEFAAASHIQVAQKQVGKKVRFRKYTVRTSWNQQVVQSLRMSRIEVPPASVLAELERILASRVFSTAGRASRLLRFLVEETVEGRGDSLKEYTLGTSVLGRKPSFDPRNDPIARVEASRLRDRLTLYYATEGSTGLLRISLPKGGYVPAFEISAPELVPPVSLTVGFLQPPKPQGWAALRTSWQGLVAVSVLLTVAGATMFTLVRLRPPAVSTMRLSVIAPANTSVDSFAISPDGVRIVVAGTAQNTSYLFLRPINSFAYQRLSGTEGAWNPFWSPDGRSIGFFTLGKLKIVEAGTGAVRTLCEAGLGRGGTWSRLGEIVFASGALGPLYRISASGGKPVPATWINSERGEIGHRWPQFLPDGRHFLYFAAALEYDKFGIDLGDLDSQRSRRIVAADTNGLFAPDPSGGSTGRLLFGRHGTLTTQAFEPTQFRTVGEPAIVSPEVNCVPLSRYAQFSVSNNGVLAYVSGSPFNRELVWLDRSGAPLGRVGEPGDFSGLHLSSDGKRVILNRSDPEMGYPGVWSVDLTRGSSSRVTSGSVDFSPVWSPNASQVVFARAPIADGGMSLLQVPASGGPTHRLSDLSGAGFPSDWSSNGRYVAYTGFVGHGGSGIYILPVRDGDADKPWAYLETDHNEGGAVFSRAPDGADPKWIAYTSDESGRNEVYIQSFPRDGFKVQVSAAGGSQPKWRWDSKELYYLSPNGDLMALDTRVFPTLEAGLPRLLFPIGYPVVSPAPSLNFAADRNGQRFLVSRRIADAASAMSLVTNWMAMTSFN